MGIFNKRGRMSLFTVFSLIALVLFMMAAWMMLDLSLNTYKKMAQSKHQAGSKRAYKSNNPLRTNNSGQLAKPQKMAMPSPLKTETNPVMRKLAVGYYLLKAKKESADEQQIIAENERTAINILSKYAKAQEVYFKHYGYYCDSPDNLIIEGDNKYTIIDPDLMVLNSANSPETADKGYFYVQTPSPAAKSGQDQKYRLNALPAEYNQTGINSFYIDQKGIILQENNGAKLIRLSDVPSQN